MLVEHLESGPVHMQADRITIGFAQPVPQGDAEALSGPGPQHERLDEVALQGKTFVAKIDGFSLEQIDLSISDFGTFNGHRPVPSNLTGAESASLIRKILENKKRGSNSEKLVLMNAAVAIYLSGKGPTLPAAFAMATESIASRAALNKLKRMAEATNL